MDKYTDNTIMQVGKHKGKALVNIPADWFFWYEENFRNPDMKLIHYIEENRMALMQEVDIDKISQNKF